MSMEIRKNLDLQPMSYFQWLVIGICMILNAIDGFDVLVMAFTASAVSAEWSLTGTQLGALLSSGLVGMSLGSFLLAPWGDKLGRRPLVLFCLTISGAGMILAGLSQSPTQLGMMRAITGLGIGGILASTNVMASEYASQKWRSLAISLQATGYSLGALFGGMIAIYLLREFGWRSVFFAGGGATLAIVPIVYFFLPESLDFLLAKQPPNALRRINQVGKKLGIDYINGLPQLSQAGYLHQKSSFTALLSPRYLSTTLFLWTSSFLILFGFYFVMSWTPKLLTSAGLTAEQGITGGVLLSAGGIFGTALLGLISSRFKLAYVQAVFLIVTSLLMLIFVKSVSNPALAFFAGLLLGVTVNGCLAGLIAMAPGLYEAGIRTTGLGFAIGIGRVGGMISPLVAGHFIDANWQPGSLYSLFAVAFVFAMILTLMASAKISFNANKISRASH